MLQGTNRSCIGHVGLLGVFFLLYVVALGIVTELLWVGSRGVSWLSRHLRTKRPVGALSVSRAYYFSSVVALGPVIGLAMASIGSLGTYEIFLIIAFIAVGVLYVAKRS
jgi:hypothetical protein